MAGRWCGEGADRVFRGDALWLSVFKDVSADEVGLEGGVGETGMGHSRAGEAGGAPPK